MPFNRNKWAVILEPTYQYFKAEKETIGSADYKSIELPLGIRHYLFLNENSKLFVNGSFVLDMSLKSEVKRLPVKTGSNFAFGAGYKYNDRYSLELRYFTNRDLFFNYMNYTSDYKTVSVIFGYNLF